MANGMICTSRASLGAKTADNLDLPEVDVEEVRDNMVHASDVESGGQAEVYMCRWKCLPGGASALGIAEGTYLAFKHLQLPSDSRPGRFYDLENQYDVMRARNHSLLSRRLELNIIGILKACGCGSRVVKPLGKVSWPGEWDADSEARKKKWWKPMYGYMMPAYERGSLSTLLSDICHRRLPATTAQRFLNLGTLSSELATMLGEVHKIHTTEGARMMIQDITANNILVDDSGPTGMRLLICDPSMALPIKLLNRAYVPGGTIVGTYLWGSMRTRSQKYDPKADLYSLCFCFAEMWLVAEGALMPAIETVQQLRAHTDIARGVRFMRGMLVETLRNLHNGGRIQTRIQRHLPVSWLGVWLMLLGFRDYETEEKMNEGLPCLRPEETEVLELAILWARIAAAAEDLPQELTPEQAQSEACKPLVSDMCTMLARLLELSHLDYKEQQDVALPWVAANFMAQKHPLVAAMKEQGATRVGTPEQKLLMRGWHMAVEYAGRRSGLDAHQDDLQRGLKCEQQLGELWQCLERIVPYQKQNEVPWGLTCAAKAAVARLKAKAAPKRAVAAAPKEAPPAVAAAPKEAPPAVAAAAGAAAVREAPPAVAAAAVAAGQATAPAAPGGSRDDILLLGEDLPYYREVPARANIGLQAALPAGALQQGQVAGLGMMVRPKRKADALGAGELGWDAPRMGHATRMQAYAARFALMDAYGGVMEAAEAMEEAQRGAAGAAAPAAATQRTSAPLPQQPFMAAPEMPARRLPFRPAGAGVWRAGAPAAEWAAALPNRRLLAPDAAHHLPTNDGAAAAAEAGGSSAGSASTAGAEGSPAKRRRAGGAAGQFVAAAADAGNSGTASPTEQRSAAATGVAADVHPEQGESWQQWLERIQPQLVAGVLEVLLPGEHQLPAFKGHVTDTDAALKVLDLWASSSRAADEDSVPGVRYSNVAKGAWNAAVFARCGLALGRLPGGGRGTEAQQLRHYMRDVVPGVSGTRIQTGAQAAGV